jgi:hypothetical protein
MAHYSTERQHRTIDAHCVSNTLYRKARDFNESPGARRRTNTSIDKIAQAEQWLASSGIIELRNFILRIPYRSQIAEAEHFLNVRLLTLIEKTSLWLNSQVPRIIAEQPLRREVIDQLSTELDEVIIQLKEST